MYLELFEGAIYVNKYLVIINFLLIIHFVYSYVVYCYRKGFKIDYWHFNILIGYFIPFLIMYPFAGSFFHLATIGEDFHKIQNYIDQAYLITITGYILTYAGFYYYDFRKTRGLLYSTCEKINNFFSRYLFNSVNNKISLYVCSLLGLILIITFLIFSLLKYGIDFNLRGHVLSDDFLRPTYNFILKSYVPIVSLFLLLRYLQYRQKRFLIIFIILALTTIISGSRSIILTAPVQAIMYFVISKKKNVSLLKYGILGVLTLAIVFFLGGLREGRYSFLESVISFNEELLYGNNFSDIRDFAWILAYWDNQYILGKSYLAALISFIPRFISALRENWSISIYTNSLVGFDPTFPGLRPGKFGESYFNFGLVGVGLIGFLGGYILRFVDTKIKSNIYFAEKNFIKMYSCSFIYILISKFYITADFWEIYVFFSILALGYLARQLFKPSSSYHKYANIH